MQTLYLVLKLCVLPRVNYLLRTLPPDATRSHATRLDVRVLQLVRDLFGIVEEEGNNW